MTRPKKNKPGAGAPKGNKNSLKFKEKEDRQRLFAQLIEHLENAWDQESFAPCDWDTVQKYCKDYPEDFPADKIAQAKRRGHQIIEGLLKGIAHGKIKGNAVAAIFLAKNKIKYTDKLNVDNNLTVKDSDGIVSEVFGFLEESIRSKTTNRLGVVHEVDSSDGEAEPTTSGSGD